MQSQWRDAGFGILAVSADSIDKASSDVKEFGWTFDVACELSESDMAKLGLYISDPLSPDETDRRFAEPGVFCMVWNLRLSTANRHAGWFDNPSQANEPEPAAS